MVSPNDELICCVREEACVCVCFWEDKSPIPIGSSISCAMGAQVLLSVMMRFSMFLDVCESHQ